MANQNDHVSIHMPKYETTPIHFVTPTYNVSVDIAEIQNYIREKAEKNLKQCESFEVSLPPSITGITDESTKIKFNSLFQTPTLNELETLSTNPDGSSKKLNDEQLKAVLQAGEFEVHSIHFPGQSHRWKLSKLLQSGVQPANDALFKELSWAVYMLMIFARDRVLSNCFSFKAVLRSWKAGFVSLIDALIGLPAVESAGIDLQVENERNKFLVIELSPNESEKEMHEAFCAQIPILLEMMIEHEKYAQRQEKNIPPRMLPYPHHFVTPNNIEIDLRLHNKNLQTKLKSIISSLLSNNTPKGWFIAAKRRLINQYRNEQSELGLSKEEIAKRVQTQLNVEYAERAFETIENSREIENLSPGLGRLLVAQARAILVMKSVVQNLTEDLKKHLTMIREKLVKEHPIKSKINRWIETKLFEERINYIHQHEWDAHQLSIDQCKTLGNQQAAYFIQRDLTFRQDHESTLRLNLKSPVTPQRTIDCSRAIWFRKNWIVERTYPLPTKRIPTLFAKYTYSNEEEERRQRLISSEPEAQYSIRRKITYSTTTRYPFWRWKLFALRTYCWLSNAIYGFCLVVPFGSPVSFRALLSPKPFQPNYELNKNDLKLHESSSSKTQSFISRLVALWSNVRHSRQQFEQTPDRGFLGKNIQRLFNQFWNYIIKGALGTVAVCTVYPLACSIIPTFSFILGVLSPIWMPILTLLFHILQILIYDASSAGEYGRKIFCLINIVITDFLLCGIVQPILVLFALIASPIISLLIAIYALLHRCTRGAYDKIIHKLVVKRLARIPAHDGFLARRVAGPGLAAEYFYQVASPEVLAALESLIEQNELKTYRSYVEQILMKPIDEYRQFFNSAFEPFSAQIQINNSGSTYGRMNDVVNEHIRSLRTTIEKRNDLLQLSRSAQHDRIRLTETDLTAVLIEGTQLVEKWYPKRILPYLNKNDLEKFWNDQDLEQNDWFGLTSKLLQDLFCRDFLTPLEQTDVFYSLKVDHLTLSKYAHMIHSADIHDDLDVVTSVYLPESSYSIQYPSFNQDILDPNASILQISTDYSHKQCIKPHGRVYRFSNRKGNYTKISKNLSKFVDYTSITCRFSIPIEIPEVAYISVIIFNRYTNNSMTTSSIKNITLQDICQLIEFNKKFYDQPMLPSNLPITSSLTTNNNTTNDDLLMINNAPDNNDDDILDNNIAVLDEKLL
ncbi:unnamed protein product [Rotaria magnacalcarata]|uniref:Uncharacterized protein n=6 Tax=Rotaria magnacalcarata TaxID=392030 RepID=A0A814WSA4_9BILA|nr:unnamed protein product [Rotaria magnacalcarata]CAF1205573.1 unnamed protein product [Rotaria magnacalcarata]